MSTATLPEGFTLARGYFADVGFAELQSALPWQQTQRRMFGKTISTPRLICGGGSQAYRYGQQTHAAGSMPAPIAALLQRVQVRTGYAFNTYVANLYRDGRDSIAMHADDEPELGPDPVVASLTFGGARTFQVRHNLSRTVYSFELQHGDLLIMGAGVQRAYQHAVPKRPRAEPRINVTFRNVL